MGNARMQTASRRIKMVSAITRREENRSTVRDLTPLTARSRFLATLQSQSAAEERTGGAGNKQLKSDIR